MRVDDEFLWNARIERLVRLRRLLDLHSLFKVEGLPLPALDTSKGVSNDRAGCEKSPHMEAVCNRRRRW
jgi:hypothetical protein